MKKTMIWLLTFALVLCGALVALAEDAAGGDTPGAGGTGGREATPLTYEDLGISVSNDVPNASYLNPRTYVITQDNENNSHTGSPDYDLNEYLPAQNTKSPIEVRFDLDVLPQRDAYLCIYAWDCDENNTSMPEYDAVYVNDTKIGAMTGQDSEWNTTFWSVPVSALKLGANYVTVHIGAVDRSVTPYQYYEYYANRWCIEVKWVQLMLDGGSHTDKPDKFSVNLQNASLKDQNVYCEALVQIEAKVSRDYEVEYSLVDRTDSSSASYMQIISTDVTTISGTKVSTYGTLHMPLSSPAGLYSVQVVLRKQGESDILAADEKYFEFDGTVPSFDITNFKATLSEEDFTPGPITMRVSADISDPSVVSNVKFWLNGKKSVTAKINSAGHATGSFQITENGEYAVELRYVKDGKNLNAIIYVTVGNIVKPQNLRGDVNDDKVVNETDCKLVRRHLLGQKSLTKAQAGRADVDEDGKVTVADYLIIRQIILGL